MPRSRANARAKAKAAVATAVYGVVGLAWLRGADWVMDITGTPWLERYTDLAFIVAAGMALCLIIIRYRADGEGQDPAPPANDRWPAVVGRQRTRDGRMVD
jgi:hypothetical protein